MTQCPGSSSNNRMVNNKRIINNIINNEKYTPDTMPRF